MGAPSAEVGADTDEGETPTADGGTTQTSVVRAPPLPPDTATDRRANAQRAYHVLTSTGPITEAQLVGRLTDRFDISPAEATQGIEYGVKNTNPALIIPVGDELAANTTGGAR